MWWNRLSVDQRRSSSFFFHVLRFLSETIFLRTILARSWWWNVGFKFICWSRNGSRISFLQSSMHDEGKILLSVEMLNKFSKCQLLILSSMMRGKRCFFKVLIQRIFKVPRCSEKCRRFKGHAQDVCHDEALSYWRIEVLKLFSKHGCSWWRLFSVIKVVVFLKCFRTQIDIFEVLELKRRDRSIQKLMTSFSCKSSSL